MSSVEYWPSSSSPLPSPSSLMPSPSTPSIGALAKTYVPLLLFARRPSRTLTSLVYSNLLRRMREPCHQSHPPQFVHDVCRPASVLHDRLCHSKYYHRFPSWRRSKQAFMAGPARPRYVLAALAFSVTHLQLARQGSQLLLTVVDSLGQTGGFTNQFYNVTGPSLSFLSV